MARIQVDFMDYDNNIDNVHELRDAVEDVDRLYVRHREVGIFLKHDEGLDSLVESLKEVQEIENFKTKLHITN